MSGRLRQEACWTVLVQAARYAAAFGCCSAASLRNLALIIRTHTQCMHRRTRVSTVFKSVPGRGYIRQFVERGAFGFRVNVGVVAADGGAFMANNVAGHYVTDA